MTQFIEKYDTWNEIDAALRLMKKQYRAIYDDKPESKNKLKVWEEELGEFHRQCISLHCRQIDMALKQPKPKAAIEIKLHVWKSHTDLRMYGVLAITPGGVVIENYTSVVDDFGNLVPVICWKRNEYTNQLKVKHEISNAGAY